MTTNPILECVQRTKEHARLLHAWRLDPQTIEMSFHQKKMDETEFWSYFQQYFFLKDLPPLFAFVDGCEVGFIGFTPYVMRESPDRRAAEISIVIAPEFRGKGIGRAFLEQACQFAKQQGYDDLIAQIKPHNSASIRLFEKLNFEFLNEIAIVIDNDHVPARIFCRRLRPIEAPQKVKIIAEAGSNWRMGTYERDLKMAQALVNVAKEAGCDIVKFQTYRPETVYVPNAGRSDYLESSEEISAIFKDLAMPYEMVGELAKMCKAAGLEFMSTPFSLDDFQAVDPYVSRHKIASYEISHLRLLEQAAKSQKPLILSTGASDLSDISWAVEFYKAHGGKDLTLLQCSAQYPANEQAMNLRAITTLKTLFGVPVGLSDHSRDPIAAPVAAVALGAKVIEKHFTLNRNLPGPDHTFAIEPDELKSMVQAIRRAEAMCGTGIKEVLEDEKELYLFARRRIQATKRIKTGEILQEGKNIAILRPGKQKGGCHPKYIDQLVGKRATRDIELGEGVEYGDCK